MYFVYLNQLCYCTYRCNLSLVPLLWGLSAPAQKETSEYLSTWLTLKFTEITLFFEHLLL